MDKGDQQLIKEDRRGGFCLVFQNSHGLQMAEINKTFSQYGQVCDIRNVGFIMSYHFVTYQKLKQAERAVEGLKNHPKIKLAYHTKGKKNDNFNDDDSTKMNNRERKDSTKSDFQFKSNNLKKFNKNPSPKHKSEQKESGHSNFLIKKNYDEVSSDKLLNNGSSKNRESNSEVERYFHSRMNNKNKSLSPASSIHSNNVLSVSHYNSIDDRLPDLVTSNGRKYGQKKVLPSVELVFANIHEKFGIYYMLHLLEAYDPIAISSIHPTQRYCLVYLKSTGVAEEVERAYDGKFLCGRKLLVLPTKKLIEESKNC